MADSHYDLDQLTEFSGTTDLVVQTQSADSKKTPQKATLPNSTELAELVLTDRIADVSTAGQIYIACPHAGTVTSVRTVLNGTIATGDATLTVKNNAGTSMGTITIAQSGSAAGDKDSLAPSSNNTVAANDSIEIETDGSSTNAVSVAVTVVVTRA